jgi:hypothetical protein
MKLNQFEQAVLYALACVVSKTHPHVNTFLMLCVSTGEIIGNVKEGIKAQRDFIDSLNKDTTP